MKTIQYLVILLFTLSFNISNSQHVDIETAENVAVQFYINQFNHFEGNITPEKIHIKESFSIKEGGEEVLFIFNISHGGFVIIPAEKAIEPVLGYSFGGEYTPTKTSSNFLYWIQTYKNKVSHIKKNKLLADNIYNKKWEDLLQNKFEKDSFVKNSKDIEPLITANWNQDFPYNIFCPEEPLSPSGLCYVGPVGVAMGQIMYYWRYPITGTGSISYYNYPYGTINVNFGETNYAWTGMSDAISNINPQPIAQLLFHCAASVETDFGPYGSGAYSFDVPNALTSFFGYDESCEYLQKSGTTLSIWKQMLKDELDNLQPVYYSGQSTEGGHAFVVDGYQESEDDYFHINFGWSGYMNGYFLITDAGGFTDQQAMVRNILPGGDYPYYCQGADTITFLSGTIDDGSAFKFEYENNSSCSWLLTPQSNNDSISGLVINFSSFHTEAINDVVSIYDGPTNSYPLLGSYSGSSLPPQITSTGNEVLVNFSTNSSITESGWLLTYVSDLPVFCSGSQTYNNLIDTLSDGSGQFNYQNGTSCSWLIEPPDTDELTFYFTSFETEEENDVVKFYDTYNNELLAEYSGYYPTGNLPPAVTSPSGGMFITFNTDILNNAPGWEGIYQSGAYIPPPINITIEDSIYSLEIVWDMPDLSDSSYTFLGFNIFRNGVQLNTSLFLDTTFVDIGGPGEWEYCVSAVYEEGESNTICADIIIPCYGTLEMNITDSISGMGIEGIIVTIGDASIISGFNGLAMIMLPEGTHDIIVNSIGYDPFFSTVTLLCDETTFFDLELIPSLYPPLNFEAEIFDENTVYCTWDPVDTAGFMYSLLGYNVYRNDTLLNATILVGALYYDFNFYAGNHEYCVTSVYDIAESEKVCEEIFITGNLNGNVHNIFTFIPVAGAIVSLGDYSDTTDPSGNFSISNILAGSYEIEVTAENYSPFPPGINIEILEGSMTTIDIPLSPLYLNPPINLQSEILSSGDGVKLFWNPPLTHPWIFEGYNVYRREWGVGDFEKINDELVSDTLLIDPDAGGCNNIEYFVTSVYNAGESQGSNILFVIIPGFTKLYESNIKIYPNPANDKISINFHEFHRNNKCELTLYNYLGEISLTKYITSNVHDLIMLDLTNLQEGIYILEIKFVDFNFSEKIIVQ